AIDAIAARAKGGGQLSELARTRLTGFSNARIAVMNRTLVQVFSIGSFLPEGQPDKLTIVRDIRRRIDAKQGALSADTQKKLEDTRRYLAVDAPVNVGDLPNWVKVQFVDDTGELGRFVVFRNSGSKSDYLVSKELHETFFTIEGPDGPIPTAGNLYVMPEMLDTVASDGPVVVALALLVVLLTAFALFRNFLGVASVAITVVLAVLWLVGVMYVLEWKANFFNLIAIPLLLGMGQDYALHLYHRYQHDGIGKMRRILRETGGAVLMTTVTTIIGFSGMLFANHLGILSLAWTSVVGLAFCFAAAVFILPAVLVMVSRFSQRRQPVANGDAE
ncbi:MAG: preprotein translocase subunit SecF, partial [Myxococcota bacterium]